MTRLSTSTVALLLAVNSLTITTNAFVPLNSRQATQRQQSRLFEDSSPSDTGDDPDALYDANDEDNCLLDDNNSPVKCELMDAIASRGDGTDKVVFGFGETGSIIPELAKSLENKYVLPLEKPSTWKLLYTNAPDLLGLQGGPVGQLESLAQELTATTLTLTLKYKPSDGIVPQLMGNFLDNVSDDRLTQTVVFEYEEKSSNVFNLKLQSTVLDSTRFGALPAITLPTAVAPSVEAFKVDFNDGDLRMERTVQGDFLAIYKRV